MRQMMARNTQNKTAAKNEAEKKPAEEPILTDDTAQVEESEPVADPAEDAAKTGDAAASENPDDEGEQPGDEPENPESENNEGTGGETSGTDQNNETGGNEQHGTIMRADKQVMTPPIAVVTQFFQRANNGDTVRADHPEGKLIDGALAVDAVAFGWAKWLTDEEIAERQAAAAASDSEE